MATGNEISGGGSYSRYDWLAYLDIETVASTDTTLTVRLKYGYGSYYEIDVYANGSCDYAGSWNGSIQASGNGWWQWTQVGSADVTLSKGASAYTQTFSARIQATGGFGNGTSWVSNSVTVPQRSYSQPRKPKDFAASYVSDSSAKLTWTPDYTDMSGAYPWTGVYVDRRTDDGSWANIANVSWSVTSYTDNAAEAGRKYDYRLCAYGPGGTSEHTDALTVYTTPAAFSGLSASKTGEATLSLTASDAPKWYDSLEWQLTADNGATWAGVSASQSGDGWSVSGVPAGTVKVRVRATKSGLTGAWAVSNAVTTICPPSAPSVAIGSSVCASGSQASVSWVPNHPDMSSQTAAQVEFVGPDGASQTVSVDGSATSALLLVSQNGKWSARVRTKGLHADWGAWSSYAGFTVATAPQAWFDSPAADGEGVIGLPLAVKWSVVDPTGVSSQTLTLVDSSGSVVWSSRLSASARSFELGYAQADFKNQKTYGLRLDVTGGSTLTTAASRSFGTAWEPPAPPTLTVRYDDRLAASVAVFEGVSGYSVIDNVLEGPMQLSDDGIEMYGAIEFGDGEIDAGTAPTAKEFTVSRVLADGSTLQLGGGMSSGQGAVDPLPPLNTPFEYIAVAYAESGAATVARLSQTLESDKVAFNFGKDAGEAWLGYYGLDHSRKISRSRELYHFADNGENDGLPMSYGIDETDVTEGYDVSIIGRAEYDKFLSLAQRYGEAWIRDLYGDRALCSVDWSVRRHKGPNVWDVSIDATRCAWEEPANG